MNKVTLITTVKNESDSISEFMESIATQSRKPDELIIVDGGSTDRTIELIHNSKFIIQNPKRTRIIKRKGNRSVGRNTAIRHSTHSIIAVTDGGCILDKHWLERLAGPLKDERVDVVSGFYKPLTFSTFEKCLATYTCTMPDRLDKANFLPSSRSVAFRKSAWEKAGGYPENLDMCEDLVFDKRLKKAQLKFLTEEKAFVLWPQRKNIIEAFKQFYGYAKGDGQAHYFRKTTPFLFGRYLLGSIIFGYAFISSNYALLATCGVLVFLYLLWSINKNYTYVKVISAFFYLPLLQLTSDIAVISGTIKGLWDTQKK